MKFMNIDYPWILKQTFPKFGTVISVADNEQDDVEMDWEYIYTCIYVFMTYYICMTYTYMYTYTYTYIHTFIYIYTYSIDIHTSSHGHI